MFVHEVQVHYVAHMGTDLTPVNAARISFNVAVPKMTDKDRKLIRYLAEHQHMTPFEHQTLTVVVECPLYIRSQIHRHRTFAYNEVSRRYTSEDLTFYIPPAIRKQSASNRQASDGGVNVDISETAQELMKSVCRENLKDFENLISLGVAREQARSILPQNLMTKFYMTGNLRNWAHFLKLRLDAHAQLEVQHVAEKIDAIISQYWPESYKALKGPIPG